MVFKKQIDRVRSSKNGRVLISNFFYLSLLQIASYIFPFLTIPYLANIIGVGGFGKIAFASAIILWMQTIADWGFNYTATRDVAQNRENLDKVSDIFSRVFWARCLLMLCTFILLAILVFFIPKFRENMVVIFVTFLMVPGQIMFPDWFFQAMERMKYITILNVISKLLCTILIFIFIKEKEDYVLQPLFISSGFVLAGLIAMYYIVNVWGIRLKFVSLSSVLQTIKGSTDIFLNNLLPNLYSSLATVFLGIFHGSAANGIYDAGNKFSNVFDQLMTIVSRVFFPYLSRDISKHSLYARITIVSSLLMNTLLFIIAPYLIAFFFPVEFQDATIVLRILSIVSFVLTLDSVYGVNYLIVRGYDKQRKIICLISSVLGGFVAVFLVFSYSYIGKSLSLLFANGLLAVLSVIYVKNIKNKYIK